MKQARNPGKAKIGIRDNLNIKEHIVPIKLPIYCSRP